MIYCEAQNLLFVEVPRTGSSAIAKWLRAYLDGKGVSPVGHKHAICPPDWLHDYRAILSVRDPYERTVSTWCKTVHDAKDKYGIRKQYGESLEAYLIGLLEPAIFGLFRWWWLAAPMVIWARAHPRATVLRHETLDADFKKAVGIPNDISNALPHANVTRYDRPWQDYLSPVAEHLIRTIYAEDFARFDYPTERPAP